MVDGLAAMVWGGITVLMFTAAWRVARAIDPAGGSFQRLLHAGLIAWSTLVVSTVMVGMAGILIPLALEGLVIALTLVLHGLAPTLGRWASGANPAGGSQPGETPTGESNIGTRSIYYLWAWGALCVVCLARVIRYGLLEYPSDWDTLDYHLPVIHAWLRAQSLYAPNCQEWFVPGTNEVIGLWLSAPFSGDFLVGLINLPATFVLGLAVIELSRQMGLPAPIHHLTALLVLTAEIVVRQTLTAKNDTAAAALFVASLAYAFRHATGGRRADLWMAAASLGLLAGVKYYAIGYAAVSWMTWIFGRLLVAGWRAGAQAGIVGIVGGMMLGGYWYGRNILATGTPFFPKGHSAVTDVLSQWRPRGTWGTTLFGNGSKEVLPLLLEAIWKHAGPLHCMAAFVLPVALIWLVWGRWRLRHEDGQAGRRSAWRCLAVAVIGAGLVWGIIPFATELKPGTLHFLRDGYLPVRFGLCFLTISMVAVATMVRDCWSLLRPTHARALLLTIAASAILWHASCILNHHISEGDLTDILLTSSLIAGVLLLTREISCCVTATRQPILAAAVLIAVVAPLCVPLAERWHAEFNDHYEIFISYEKLLSNSCENNQVDMFYVGFRGYPFAGSYRQVSVSRSLRLSRESDFLSYIIDHDIDYAIVSIYEDDWLGNVDRIHKWIQRRPRVFRFVVTETGHRVYEIDRVALAELAAP